MGRCRICDVEKEANELSPDTCCAVCVDASEGLFEEDDIVFDGENEIVIVLDD